ncbi:16S rRNA (guanine(527)-N(7))-methyltransferase RsmG [Sphingomonas sp. 1P06PA]|uniref:16S rRNA (guanine(527)-N(7))-methyltransferase RsmG n=1 Tax=Sphingomonas sp. 1P06PA TaxID=554121 RepID=UPI0039A67939
MTEQEAIDSIRTRGVPHETIKRLGKLGALVVEGSKRQNLVSASTIGQIWSRHLLDSIQLVDHAEEWSNWVDLGTGAGFPGLAIAALDRGVVTMIESRQLRVKFLRETIETLELRNAYVVQGDAARISASTHDIISARAFAPLERLLPIGARFAHPETRWLLPKGRNAVRELESVRQTWQGDFEVAPSVTDRDAAIIVARNVRRKGVT